MEKQQKYWTIAIMLIWVFFSGCRKDISSSPNPESKEIFGTWVWVQSSGGFTGHTINPSTVGYSGTVEFNKNGIYKTYKDGNQKEEGKYSLIEGKSIYTTTTAHLIKYEDDITYQSINLERKDTLILSDECYDCYRHVYIRKTNK